MYGIRGTLKTVGILLSILLFAMVSAVIYLILFAYSRQRLFCLTYVVSSFSKLGCYILNVKVSVSDREKLKISPLFIVSNHLSYLDILILSAYAPACFVTSVEIKETPFLGWLCRLAGCVFVERRSKNNLSNEIQELETALGWGLRVVVFPEATSTNGDKVLRFRSPLYTAAINSNVVVLPVCINYRHINRATVSLANRDIVCWYGEMTFVNHLFLLAAQESICVDIACLGPNKVCGAEAKSLAQVTQYEVESVFLPLNETIVPK